MRVSPFPGIRATPTFYKPQNLICVVIDADLANLVYNVKTNCYVHGCVVDAHRGIVDICETHIQPYHISQEDLSEMALGNASVRKC